MDSEFGSDNFFAPLEQCISSTDFPATGASPWITDSLILRLAIHLFRVLLNLEVKNDGPDEAQYHRWTAIDDVTGVDVDEFDLQKRNRCFVKRIFPTVLS